MPVLSHLCLFSLDSLSRIGYCTHMQADLFIRRALSVTDWQKVGTVKVSFYPSAKRSHYVAATEAMTYLPTGGRLTEINENRYHYDAEGDRYLIVLTNPY
jgi:uncharacterized glyoxalase superfamily metalloenzyme YdcJ